MLLNVVSALAAISVVSADVFQVKVGDGGFVYNPANTVAKNGDVVTFQFVGSPGNHTVSQAAFNKPCEQLDGGFDSGYVFVPPNFSGSPAEWNLTVSDASKPIWFYCKQSQPSLHCTLGMVGAINAPSSGNTLDGFTTAAKALSGSPPAQSSGAMSGVGAAATAAPGPLASAASGSASSTAPASGSGTGAPASTSSSAAASITSNSIWTLLAAVMGIVIA